MSDRIIRQCENCRFFADGEGKSHGNRYTDDGVQLWRYECRRYPRYEQHWFDDWCGEFLPR